MPESYILIATVAVLIIFYIWYRVSFWRKRIRIETREAEEAVDRSFKDLKKKIEKQIEMIDNTPGLSPEEKEIRDKLQEALDNSEEIIKKEIGDIEKELK